MIAQMVDKRMLSPETEERVKLLLANKMSCHAIARKVGIARATVAAIKHGRRSLKLIPPEKLTKEQAVTLANKGGQALHDKLAPERKRQATIFGSGYQDNLVFSLKCRFTGILAEQLGIYIPPEERNRPS